MKSLSCWSHNYSWSYCLYCVTKGAMNQVMNFFCKDESNSRRRSAVVVIVPPMKDLQLFLKISPLMLEERE
ncbi:hypothetical protein FRX31_025561 [Thalictrum thalictroides]|uniref:Uncharacterized protein n=1 Tax=Thalictrum thalictroides TaxID=46969 RepID=A0A7J6VIA5_THATH|nr:hypothetical protein FRX31_025561 [Thalictrum thalictroides]